MKKYVTVIATNLFSQAALAGFLFLVALRFEPAVADQFSLLLQTGLMALSGIVMGVVYGLALGRPDFDLWSQFAISAAVFSLLVGLVSSLVWVSLGNPNGLLFIISGAAGALYAWAGTLAVRLALLGRPLSIPAVSGSSSASLLAGLLLSLVLPSSIAVYCISVSWVLGGMIAVGLVRRVARDSIASTAGLASGPSGRGRMLEHTAALVASAATATILPVLASTALLALPAGTLALAYFVGRFIGAGVNLLVNSVLSVRYHWANSPILNRGVILFAVLTALVGAVWMLWLALLGSDQTVWVTVLPWLIMVATSAILLREANAQLRVRTLSIKSTIDLLGASVVVAALFVNPSVVGYFCLFTVSGSITCSVTLASQRRWWEMCFAAVTGALAMAASFAA
ncbi:hypothetical protein [Microbacterium invictum]|uniref:Uncharacterized protein n=1 Tax=Microbacterium invictum TaxID=515415 RepID=A0ABZ0VB66_9MICO|nr:hypothetical protein [Microbacterium invictum]WQB69800.1 hypothetical protein T9R20_14020 [Microbacterium invictum]